MDFGLNATTRDAITLWLETIVEEVHARTKVMNERIELDRARLEHDKRVSFGVEEKRDDA